MPDRTPPQTPRDALAVETIHLREALELDAEWERLEVRPLPAPGPQTDSELTAALNAFFVELELPELGLDWREEGWHELHHEEAVRLLTYLLSQTMAYDMPKREHPEAREGALSFLSLFGPDSRVLTNSTLYTVLLPDGSPPTSGLCYSSGASLTSATFEGGVVAVGAGRMGLLWFTDED
ncbi:hypothetical protein F0U60_44015 [Archangium minus]|uniref:Uncharacterized protein n=1 Tax=Archangium minus TaxID=83450 RepID=A0ABY9X4I8_9BACT|nr:hypothetical protein F0U60_44015 [Archangium minus]